MPKTERLFDDDNPLALRQPRTDPLILGRLLAEAGQNQQLEDDAKAVHPIILRWADLESSGQLAAHTHETQLQGQFCEQILGQVLGYAPVTDQTPDGTYHLEQEFHITNTGSADAALGFFRPGQPKIPLAVVELKGANIHLDRARSNGRNAVAQCWDYLYALPADCRWGIISNFVSFRLYDRTATPAKYEHFTLQSLRKFETFRQFYAIFHRKGLIEKTAGQPPRILDLIRKTNDRQRAVGDELYAYYSQQRTHLIAHLISDHAQPLDAAVEMAQRLFDRVIFIAFCEDRGLLPGDSLKRAYRELPGFSAVTNPRWQNFKSLFRFVDRGSEPHGIPQYNGGLFADHPVDQLELPDEPWTNFFNTLGTYDFADEVNLDVLGHLFERSITEIEKLKETGLFGNNVQKAREYAEMPQSAKRKQLGTYYTPAVLTERIVRYTVDELIDERFAKLADELKDPDRVSPGFWSGCFEILRNLKVVDPACGSGAFLFQAYQCLSLRYGEVIDQMVGLSIEGSEDLSSQVPRFILNDNLYGVDLSPEAVEISQLALWIQSADKTQTLATLSGNIVHGNSLVHDPQVAEHGFDWKEKFPDVFNREGYQNSGGGFDCVIGNPPWNKIKVPEREFFALPRPDIATTPKADKREKLVAALATEDPTLLQAFLAAKEGAKKTADFCRDSKLYPLTGKGEINTYAVFTELAERLVAPKGRVGFLIPTALATKKTTSAFFAHLADENRLIRLYDFSNRKRIFADVNPRENFSVFCFGGKDNITEEADFVFRSIDVEEIEDDKRHVKLPGDAISLVNPNTQTAPVFKSTRDARLTYRIYREVPVFVDRRRNKTGNPWGVKFKTIFHQTNDAKLFHEADQLQKQGFMLQGNTWTKAGQLFLPVYEAKMCRPYNHRYANIVVDESAWMMQGRSLQSTSANLQSPEHLVLPRYWAAKEEIAERIDFSRPAFLGFRDIARNDDTRTFLANMVPYCGVINTLPLAITAESLNKECCLLANMNSFALDYVTRQKLGDTHLNYFVVEQLPLFTPDRYDEPCPWDRKTTLEQWISERVLKLTSTAEDMLPLAEACGFTSGSFKEYGGKLNKWNERERALLCAELDAAYFILYGLDRADSEYSLSTFTGIDQPNPHCGGASTAQNILDTYEDLSARAMAGR